MIYRRIILVFIFLSILITLSLTFLDEGWVILWSPNCLKIEDFKGNIPENSEFGAISFLSISCEIIFEKKQCKIIVKSEYNKEKSWYKKESNNELLEHEQKHFDLQEIYARKLREKASQRKWVVNSIDKHLNDLYNEIFEMELKAQDRYDVETDLSRNRAEQKKWNEFIDKELERLKEFKDTLIIIKY